MDVSAFRNANGLRDQTRRQLGFVPEQVVVGKIARLFELKGHEYVIQAARKVVDRCPHVRFLFVGDGLLREALQAEIDQRGLHELFRFAGLVPPDQIPAMIGAIDVLVHASLREGLARTLPQALIAGKPVVSFDVDGAREVVHSDQTGYLLPPRDVPGLVESLVRLAGDPALRQRLGQQGCDGCLPRFGHQEMTARLRQLYVELLEGAEQGRGRR